MKNYCFIFTFFTLFTNLSAQVDTTQIIQEDSIQTPQEDTPEIPFVSYWSLGDQYHFRVTKEKQRWKGEELTKDDKSSYDATFTVIDSTENSYKIKWIYATDFEGDFQIPAQLVERFSKYEMNEVIYSTSETGEFQGVDNWKEMADMMDSMFVDMMAIYVKEDPSLATEKFTEIMKPLRSMYCSKEGIEGIVLKELHYFHFPFGVAFTKGTVFEYEDLLPNMFGGDPIKGEVKLYIDSVDYENEYCELIHEMDLNEEDTKRMMNDVFVKMNIPGNEMEKLMEKSTISIKDRNKYSYYYFPGVPVKIETLRESLMDFGEGMARNTESIVIELFFPEE